jgi:hypothetical protein
MNVTAANADGSNRYSNVVWPELFFDFDITKLYVILALEHEGFHVGLSIF